METVLLPAFDIPPHLYNSPSSATIRQPFTAPVNSQTNHCGLQDCFISWPSHHSAHRWSVFDSFDPQDIDDYGYINPSNAPYYPSAARSRRAAELKSRARSRLMPLDPHPRSPQSCSPRNPHSSPRYHQRGNKSSNPLTLKRQASSATPSTPIRTSFHLRPSTPLQHTPASTTSSPVTTRSHKPLRLSPFT